MPNMQDQRGRTRRRNPIGEQFSYRTIAMMRSPAYRVLSRAAHQVLSRIEVELAQHGGLENGALPVTFDHFVEYGLHRRSVAPAIRELATLGFIEVTRHGCARNGDLRQASTYRLTNRPTGKTAQTDEWRKIKSVADAEALAHKARRDVNPRARALGIARAEKQKPSTTFCCAPVAESATETRQTPVAESAATVETESATTSRISVKAGQTDDAALLRKSELIDCPPGAPAFVAAVEVPRPVAGVGQNGRTPRGASSAAGR
jgi:hypothetical protein